MLRDLFSLFPAYIREGDPISPSPVREPLLLFPAYAGVILCYCVDIRNNKSFPRMRGGDPCNANFRGMMDYFFPAYAGLTKRPLARFCASA